jgi:hypothetical protein
MKKGKKEGRNQVDAREEVAATSQKRRWVMAKEMGYG